MNWIDLKERAFKNIKPLFIVNEGYLFGIPYDYMHIEPSNLPTITYKKSIFGWLTSYLFKKSIFG